LQMQFRTITSGTSRSMSFSILWRAVLLAAGSIVLVGSTPASSPSPKPPAIVIGFLGGFVSHDNPVHSEVQLAARLSKEMPEGVEVRTFESYHGKNALDFIDKILDTNHDGQLSAEEKQDARIAIYGHSWGGAESIYVARMLQKAAIPVLITIQVDSFCRPGGDDMTIPANVAQAANFYQPNGIVHGHHDIHAANSASTHIIGNFRFNYQKSALNCEKYPWWDRYLVRAHTQIECDPVIWDQVDALIRKTIEPSKPDSGTPGR
jgi:hypothetical protein